MHLIYPACITALAANDVDADWRVATDDWRSASVITPGLHGSGGGVHPVRVLAG